MNITLTDRSASIMFPQYFFNISKMDIDIMQDEGRLTAKRFFHFTDDIAYSFSSLQSMS
jgi:hypothetical protein